MVSLNYESKIMLLSCRWADKPVTAIGVASRDIFTPLRLIHNPRNISGSQGSRTGAPSTVHYGRFSHLVSPDYRDLG